MIKKARGTVRTVAGEIIESVGAEIVVGSTHAPTVTRMAGHPFVADSYGRSFRLALPRPPGRDKYQFRAVIPGRAQMSAQSTQASSETTPARCSCP